MLVGDRVVSHLHFTGHFTGRFKGTQGAGQSIHGRIFLVLARIDGSDGPRVAEWVDGKPKPYPDRAWNGWSKANLRRRRSSASTRCGLARTATSGSWTLARWA